MFKFYVHLVDYATDYLFKTEAEAREFASELPYGLEFKLCRI